MPVIKEDVAGRGSKPDTAGINPDDGATCITETPGSSVAGDFIVQTESPKKRLNHREWNPSKRWNPFNSYKLLAHVERWRNIKRGKPVPAPILITVDPANVCNLNCVWCNAEFVKKERRGYLSEKTLCNLAEFLPHWGRGASNWEPGVKAVCIAGGGEPLLGIGKYEKLRPNKENTCNRWGRVHRLTSL